jgi:hypothetical protein
MAAARDLLATTLMLALEVGIDGIPQGWSGIRPLTGRVRTATGRNPRVLGPNSARA